MSHVFSVTIVVFADFTEELNISVVKKIIEIKRLEFIEMRELTTFPGYLFKLKLT